MTREPGPFPNRPTTREKIVASTANFLNVDLRDAHLFSGLEDGRNFDGNLREMREYLVHLVEIDPVDLGNPHTREMTMLLAGFGTNRSKYERKRDARNILVTLARNIGLEDILTADVGYLSESVGEPPMLTTDMEELVNRPTRREQTVNRVAESLGVDILDAYLFEGAEDGRYDGGNLYHLRNYVVDVYRELPPETNQHPRIEMIQALIDDGVHSIWSSDGAQTKLEYSLKRDLFVDLAERNDVADILSDEALEEHDLEGEV